jgi:hypothetical protein
LPYDLRIGVTGHRNLTTAQLPAIESEVRTLLDRIQKLFEETSSQPHAYSAIKPTTPRPWGAWIGERFDAGLTTVLQRIWPAVPKNSPQVPTERQTPFRWIVVSPLAKGADRIVAKAVLERNSPHPGSFFECEVEEWWIAGNLHRHGHRFDDSR